MTPSTPISPLIAPYGGSLVDLLVPADAREAVKARASHLPSVQLSARAVCDLERYEWLRLYHSTLWNLSFATNAQYVSVNTVTKADHTAL
jgi:hypothetical protein